MLFKIKNKKKFKIITTIILSNIMDFLVYLLLFTIYMDNFIQIFYSKTLVKNPNTNTNDKLIKKVRNRYYNKFNIKIPLNLAFLVQLNFEFSIFNFVLQSWNEEYVSSQM
jgi:hypothetical protein